MPVLPRSADCVVVGGGIIGLLTAWELMRAGRQVIVCDRQPIGRESSWAGGGILSPLYPWRYPEAVLRLARWSQKRYPDLLNGLKQDSGVDPEYIQSGLLINLSNEHEQAANWVEHEGITAEFLDSTQADELQPGLMAGGQWLWLPEVGQVRNPCLLDALRSDLRRNGVEIFENVSISGFIEDAGVLSAIETNRGRINAEQALIATGAWTGGLLEQIGISLPVRPVRGQMVLLKGELGHIRHMVLKDSRYLIPRRDGRILVGSTLEEVGFDKTTTEDARSELIKAAEAIVPGLLDSCTIEKQWAGLRPGSPEGVPYMGEHPEISGLYVSSGHFRNGFVLAPASARLVADLMLGRVPQIDPADYRLERAVLEPV